MPYTSVYADTPIAPRTRRKRKSRGRAAELESSLADRKRSPPSVYQSNASGLYEVYVQSFPASGGKWQVSSGGGQYPTWAGNGRELLFVTRDKKIAVAPFTTDAKSIHFERPRPWSDGELVGRQVSRSFDLHPDGRRVAAFTAVQRDAGSKLDHVTLIFDFFDYLRRIAPAGNAKP